MKGDAPERLWAQGKMGDAEKQLLNIHEVSRVSAPLQLGHGSEDLLMDTMSPQIGISWRGLSLLPSFLWVF